MEIQCNASNSSTWYKEVKINGGRRLPFQKSMVVLMCIFQNVPCKVDGKYTIFIINVRHSSFSELNSTESTELVEKYF